METHPETGEVISETWLDVNGKPHREDAGARRTFHPETQQLKCVQWISYNLPHRLHGKPAATSWDEQGRKIHEGYFVDGYSFRPDGKADQIYFDPETGNVAKECFYDRDDTLTKMIKYNPENGLKVLEEHYCGQDMLDEEDILHSDSGPARIVYDPQTGEIQEREFYQNGLKVNSLNKQIALRL